MKRTKWANALPQTKGGMKNGGFVWKIKKA
jgi:hypothetical protein